MADPAPRFVRVRALVRRTWPWLMGLAIVVFVARKVPFDAFREAIGNGPRPGLIAVEIVVVLIALVTDAGATWVALVVTKLRRPLGEVAAVRGASFVLFLVNYILGQGAFGYYLKRTGAAGFQAAGVTLFLVGTNLATLLLLCTLAWGIRGEDLDTKLWLTLVAGCIAFALYLVVIALAPRVLAQREILAPLFTAGLRGHALAIAGRLPYIVVMSLGPWLAIRVWGIPVPFAAAASTMPMVVIASALPIAPAGLGTMQASMVYFFTPFATGATADDQAAHVFAFSIVHFVYMVLATLLVGLACVPFARRSGNLPPMKSEPAPVTAFPSPWRRFYESRFAPIFLLAIFAVLIATTITRFSIWIDESATLLLVGPHSYGEIVEYVKLDAHPPLWYLVLKPWLSIFGTNVLASRSESAVFMLAAFGVWYHFVRTRFSRPLALVSLALMVTNPMLLHYAVEGRMYAFALLLVGLSCIVLTQRSPRRWYVYWPLAVAMLYTHYFLAFVLAAQFIYLLVRRREHDRSILWLVVYGASIIAPFLLWLPHAFHMTSDVVAKGFWIPPLQPSAITNYVLGTFLHRLDADLRGIRVFPTLLFVAAFAYALVRAVRAKGGPFALLWCLLAVPWICLFILSCKPFIPIFHPRYVIFGLPALLTLLAAGALVLVGRWRTGVIAVLLLGQLSGIQFLRYRGFNDTTGYWGMKLVQKEIGKPIDGELPMVISASLFPFFDAKAVLPSTQRVVQLRDSQPPSTQFPESLYFDKPDWYVTKLDDLHARHVWFIDDAIAPKKDVPTSWKQEVMHVHGYARARLFTIPDPAPAP